MSERLKSILIIGSVFAYSALFFKQPFEFYWAYIVYILFMPAFFSQFGLPKLPVMIFFPLLLMGFIYCQIGLNTPDQFYKIFFGFFGSCAFYYYVVQSYDYDVEKLYKLYMKAAVIVAIIGAIQVVSYRVGFSPGYKYNYIFNKWSVAFGGLGGIRLNSVFSEPAYYAATMAPAFFTSLHNMFTKKPLYITKKQGIIIMVTYFLTYSSVGFIGIFIAIVLILINFGIGRYAIFIVPSLIFLTQWAYANVPDFRDRWDSTIDIYTTDNIYSYDIHGSSFVLYNNNHIAWENFKRNPLFGTGLGSHVMAFDKYTLTQEEGAVQIDFNKADANSMFLRLMSETGLYGMVIILVFLFKNWVLKKSTDRREIWVISNSCALVIVLYLLRQGHYFINGLPFFMWLFYFMAKQNRDRKENPEYYAELEKTDEEEPEPDDKQGLVLKPS